MLNHKAKNLALAANNHIISRARLFARHYFCGAQNDKVLYVVINKVVTTIIDIESVSLSKYT